jgi:hypothetical protein
MKKIVIVAACLIGFSSCSNQEATHEATDTNAAHDQTAPVMDSASMMKAWEMYMTPGDMHQMMNSFSGKWEGENSMWMAPDAPPSQSTSATEYKMVMGGRYLESIHTGNFEGMPFEGKSTLAYDNAKKVFMSTWIDNMGTGIMYMEGPWDEATKTMHLKGRMIDPMSGQEVDVREEYKVVDDKTHVLEMFVTQGGQEFKNMEIKFTRK